MARPVPITIMPRYDFHSPRLYVDATLASGHTLELDPTGSIDGIFPAERP